MLAFFNWYKEYINTCRAIFWERCYHVVCSDIVDRPLQSIKLDQHLVPTGIFVVVKFDGDVRDTYKRNLQTKSQKKAIVDDFCRLGTDRLVNNKRIIANQWARYLKDGLPLSGTTSSIPLAVSSLILQMLLFPLKMVSKSMATIYIVPYVLIRYSNFMTLMGNTILREFITTILCHRSYHQYIGNSSVIRWVQSTMPSGSRETLGRSVCLIP